METDSQFDLKQEAGSRERIYFIIILLLIVVAFARWFYIPKIKQAKLLRVEIKNQSMQIDTLRQFAKLKIPTLQPQQADQQATFKTGTMFEKAVEESSKSEQQVIADIVRMLTSNNVLNGVSVSGMNFMPEVNKGNYSTVPIEINLEGKYSGMLNYLGHVEKFGKLVTTDNIELTTSEKAPNVVKAKIDASIYVVNALEAPSQTAESSAQVLPASSSSNPMGK
ncbi:MAG: hypothetical protein COV46_02715 [Deltaproteobacteria bacterium CG11_big_fil_rev_8_21_14_0_20_49_13]|nr:MAG: hypothetical protein COV46_02715 [Deltaproteobacteria bacterium CG11_big_fil_rev_8_21_14_0_20_49_13]